MVHIPVLYNEVLQWLQPPDGGVVADGTLGAGGHTRGLAEKVGQHGLVVAMDRDPEAVSAAEAALSGLPVRVFHGNFVDLPEALAETGHPRVDAILMDLGLSSDQLEDRQRGFSFSKDGPLDLRFDPTRGEPASRLIERLSAEHLADLIYYYGEERFSRRIAQAIVNQRRKQPIETSGQLAELIRRVVPGSRDTRRIDPATRTFQALRIATNDELKSLEVGLRRLPDCLRAGGRLGIISFHSLEDRRVKEAFRDDPRLKSLMRKPIVPTAEEIEHNPRARSAKLRVAERKEPLDIVAAVD